MDILRDNRIITQEMEATRHSTTHQLETVSPAQTGTFLTEPMNKVDNCLHLYVPAYYNELSTDKDDQICVTVIRKHGIYCTHTGGRSIVI